MAAFGCPSCAQTVQTGWNACPHCGTSLAGLTQTPKPRRLGGFTVLVILVCGAGFLGLVLASVIAVVPTGTRPDGTKIVPPALESFSAPVVGVDPDAPDLVAKSADLVANATRVGLLHRYTCIGNEAYVRELAWAQFDIDAKRGVARALAVTCHAKKSGRRMTIKGQQTGRTLARFSGDEISVE